MIVGTAGQLSPVSPTEPHAGAPPGSLQFSFIFQHLTVALSEHRVASQFGRQSSQVESGFPCASSGAAHAGFVSGGSGT